MNSKTGKNSLIWQAKIVNGEVQPSGSEMLKKEVFAKMRKDDLCDCAQEDFNVNRPKQALLSHLIKSQSQKILRMNLKISWRRGQRTINKLKLCLT